MSAPGSKPWPSFMAVTSTPRSFESKRSTGDGLGCPCPKHRAEAQERARRVAREGFPPDSLGTVLDDAISAKVGRDLLAEHDKEPRP